MSDLKQWALAFKNYLKIRIFVFFLLGFSCGLPRGLIGSSLILWMSDSNISLTVIGFFSLVLLPYNFKFLWAPLVDRVRLPLLAKKIGEKRAWLLCFQIALIFSVCGLASSSPDQNAWIWQWGKGSLSTPIPMQTYLFALLTAFFAASQDIVVDALRINTLEPKEYGEGTGMYQFGYRMGMLVSGAGIIAATTWLDWQTAYFLIGSLLGIGLIGTFCIQEKNTMLNQRLKGREFWYEMIIAPFQDFMKRNHWVLFLLFIMLFKLCNAVLGRMAMPFYDDMGFTKNQIALVSGTIGPWVTIIGVAVGGVLVMRYPIMKLLMFFGIIEILTSLVFSLFTYFPQSIPFFLLVIIFDNIIGGMGGAVFVSFLSKLCTKKYAATQYALLSSLTMVSLSVISMYSGIWAEKMGWMRFFAFTGALMIPALILLQWLIIQNNKQPRGKKL